MGLRAERNQQENTTILILFKTFIQQKCQILLQLKLLKSYSSFSLSSVTVNLIYFEFWTKQDT